MSCQWSNPLVNVQGPCGFVQTRPLAAFLTDPHTAYLSADDKPHDGTPPRFMLPVGPQIRPGFQPVAVAPPVRYDPPDASLLGWVPGGIALRLGGG